MNHDYYYEINLKKSGKKQENNYYRVYISKFMKIKIIMQRFR